MPSRSCRSALPRRRSLVLLPNPTMTLSWLTLLLLHLFPGPSAPLLLDIHLPLRFVDDTNGAHHTRDVCPYDTALRSNLALVRISGDDERIDFFVRHSPHVTLYLADFDLETNGTGSDLNQTKVNDFLRDLRAVNVSASVQGYPCEVRYAKENTIDVHGKYAMLRVVNTPCLRSLSNAIVQAVGGGGGGGDGRSTVSSYLRRPAPIPSWVESLPEPQRTAKLELIERYGSPNVMNGFEPHVTVGYVRGDIPEQAEKDRAAALQEVLRTSPRDGGVGACRGLVDRVGVGRVGDGGTVLQANRLALLDLGDGRTSPSIGTLGVENEHVTRMTLG